jgi:TolB-like protein/DNA-binding winged helix-turn-helix (wHTH) protein
VRTRENLVTICHQIYDVSGIVPGPAGKVAGEPTPRFDDLHAIVNRRLCSILGVQFGEAQHVAGYVADFDRVLLSVARDAGRRLERVLLLLLGECVSRQKQDETARIHCRACLHNFPLLPTRSAGDRAPDDPRSVRHRAEAAGKSRRGSEKTCTRAEIVRNSHDRQGGSLLNEAFALPPATQVLLPGFVIDLAREELRTRAGEHVDLRPRSFAVLRILATNAGRLVAKNEIMDEVWDDAVVTEDSLTQCIADIRRAIGDQDHKVIRTVPRRGYLLAADRIDEGRVTALKMADFEAPGGTEHTIHRAGPWKQYLAGPRLIAGLASLTVLLGLAATFYLQRGASPKPEVHSTTAKGPSVAVLPFENLTGNPANDALADDLSEEVVAALSRFRELRVLARNMTATYRGKQNSAVDIGRALQASYVIASSVRREDGQTRVSMELVDTSDGAQVWAAKFDPPAMAPDGRSSQQQLASHVSGRIGSFPNGAIAANEVRRSRTMPASGLTTYECISFAYLAAGVGDEQARRARDCLDTILKRDPRDAIAWAALSYTVFVQRSFGVGLEAAEKNDIERRADLARLVSDYAQNAVLFAPTDPLTRMAAARAYYAHCQRAFFKAEAERALALNPNDPYVLAALGSQFGWLGLWEIGVPMAEKAIVALGPAAPRWWGWVIAQDHWRRGDYSKAMEVYEKSHQGARYSHMQLAYAAPFAGRIDEARNHVATLLRLKPGFSVRAADDHHRIWCFDGAYREKMREGLRAAGLPE